MKGEKEPARVSRSTLCQLAYEGSMGAIEQEIEGFVDPSKCLSEMDSSERNCLHWASLAGNVDVICSLVQKYELDVNCPDGLGWTPLMIAVSAGKTDAAVALMDLGANITATNRNGQTALHFAAGKGRTELADELLNRTESPKRFTNISDRFGVTALHRAVCVAPRELVLRLLQAGASPELKDAEGNTALHLASMENKTELISLLIRSDKALLRTRNKSGQIPLELATDPETRRLLYPRDDGPSA